MYIFIDPVSMRQHVSPDSNNGRILMLTVLRVSIIDPNDPRLRDTSEATGADKFNKVRNKLFVSMPPSDTYKG